MSNPLRLKAAALAIVVLLSAFLGGYPFVADAMRWPISRWHAAHRVSLGLDLRGGVHLVLGVDLPTGQTPAERETTMTQTIETLERRVNELGVAEPVIARQGARGDQILVQLPGAQDVDRARQTLQSTGVLHLQLVERGPAASAEALLAGQPLPSGTEVAWEEVDGVDGGGRAAYLLRRDSAIAGDQIRLARAVRDDDQRPAVAFSLRPEGAARLGALTGEHIGRRLAVVLDGRVRSVARIEARITTDGTIQGNFTPDETQRLAILLRSGALTVPLTYLAQQTIGPSLGADAVRAGTMASTAALAMVGAFLLVYYRGAGLNAVAALLCNLLVLLGLMAAIGVVLTLPGIAGLVLTIGIGVDSNVLVFERIKEELAAGAGPRAAVSRAFRHVVGTLLDTHVAASVGAGFLYQFGTSAIRGFAVTLALGLAANLFTSTLVSKTLFDMRRPDRTLSI